MKKINQEPQHSLLNLKEDPARQVSLDFVLAWANGVGLLSFLAMRTSQTRIIPSDDADATIFESSSVVPSFLESTTIPLTRAECASSMQYATFPLAVSHAVIFLSSPPVNRIPFCQKIQVHFKQEEGESILYNKAMHHSMWQRPGTKLHVILWVGGGAHGPSTFRNPLKFWCIWSWPPKLR